MRISFVALFLFTGLLLAGCGSSGEIRVVSANGEYVTTSSLATAAVSADAAGKTVVVTSPLSAVQSNISSATLHAWPSDRLLKVEKSGSINPTTKFTGLKSAEPEMFGAVGDGKTEETAKVQKAINAVVNGNVNFAANKTYIVANLQMKSGVNLIGQPGSTLKLPDNAHTQSYNGSVADSKGNYAGNVIGTTLDHSGGAWYDGGARAKDPANSTYIVSDIIISGLTIDGNKANNRLGDVGENGSAMGSGISINQAARVTVQNCRLINARLEGIFIGYSLHGGSDDCVIKDNTFIDNGRNGIAQITGKRNKFIGNTVQGNSGAMDVESNLVDEINNQHIIQGNYFGGSIGFAAAAEGNLHDTLFDGNTVVVASGRHGFYLSGGTMSSGIIISNNQITGGGDSSAFNIYGGLSTAKTPMSIIGNTISNFDYINAIPQLSINNVVFKNNTFRTRYGMQLYRPYNVDISDNSFTLSGGDNTAALFYVLFGQGSIVSKQGTSIIIRGNTIRGTGINAIIDGAYGLDPPALTADSIIMDNNDIDVTTYGTYPMVIAHEMTLTGNKIHLNNSIRVAETAIKSKFTNNIFSNYGTRFSLFDASSSCNKALVTDNILNNIDLPLTCQ